MREITLYCSGRDQNVRAVLTDEPREDGPAAVFDTEVICLEIDASCTGSACPVSAISTDAMDARLARSGLRPELHCRLTATCPGCDRDTEHVLSKGSYLHCTECGTTRRAIIR